MISAKWLLFPKMATYDNGRYWLAEELLLPTSLFSRESKRSGVNSDFFTLTCTQFPQFLMVAMYISKRLVVYRISANSFRENYSFLNLALCTVTFGYSTYRCGNYSREETIQLRKLFVEIRYPKMFKTSNVYFNKSVKAIFFAFNHFLHLF